MRKNFLFLTLLLSCQIAFSQISQGGKPYSLAIQETSGGRAQPLTSSRKIYRSINNDKESERARKVKEACSTCRSSFYGTGLDVSLNIKKDGSVHPIPGGTIWKLQIESVDAYGLQFYFDKYKLPPGASLFIYNDFGDILGAFTQINNHPDETFATRLIPGSTATIEYFERDSSSFEGELSIYKVIHAFKDMNGQNSASDSRVDGFGDAWDCHLDITCHTGSHDAIKNAIARISYYDRNDNFAAHCSGYLINSNDEHKPSYLVTADHCLAEDDPEKNFVKMYRYHEWIIEFDYESRGCGDTRAPLTSSSKSTNGARLLTRITDYNYGYDFALLDLEILNFADIAGVPYLGFDRTVSTTSSVISISHPKGDAKKIAFGSKPKMIDDFWEVSWNSGLTQDNSSGSPLIQSSNMLSIGSLIRGSSNCNSSGPDFYNQIGTIWDEKDDRFAYSASHFLDHLNQDPQTIPSYIPEDTEPGDGGGGGGDSNCSYEYEPPYTGVPLHSLAFDVCPDRESIRCKSYEVCEGWKVSHGRLPEICGNSISWEAVANVEEFVSHGIYTSVPFENGKEYVLTYSVRGRPHKEQSDDKISRWKFYIKRGLWTDSDDNCGYWMRASEVGWSSSGLISLVENTNDSEFGYKTYASRFTVNNNANKLVVINETNHWAYSSEFSELADVKIYEAEYFDADLCDSKLTLTNTSVSGSHYAKREIEVSQSSVSGTTNFQSPKVVLKNGFKAPNGVNFKTRHGRCFVSSHPLLPTLVDGGLQKASLSSSRIDTEDSSIYTIRHLKIYNDELKNSSEAISIFPNPTRDGLITISTSLSDGWDYDILDLAGRKLSSGYSGVKSRKLNLSGYGSQLLIVRIISSEGVYTEKVLVR